MGKSSIADELVQITLSAPDAEATTVTGTGIDIKDFDGSIKITQLVGTITGGSSPTLNGKIQDSDEQGSNFVDVPGAVFAEVDTSDTDLSISLSTRSVKRFIRYVGTIAGSPTSIDMAASAVGIHQLST